LVQAADLVERGDLSSKQLKGLFDTAFERDEDFGPVYEREKPQQISDPALIEQFIDEVIAANPRICHPGRRASRRHSWLLTRRRAVVVNGLRSDPGSCSV